MVLGSSPVAVCSRSFVDNLLKSWEMFYLFSSLDDIYSDSVKRLSFPDSLSTRLFSDCFML